MITSADADTNFLKQLLSEGQRDHVTIVSDNGDVKINKFVLGSLYTIFGNLIECLKMESDVLLLKRITKEDLALLFKNLLQQATEFSPKEQFLATIQSILVTHKLESGAGEEAKLSIKEQGDIDLDSAVGFITEDCDYIDNEIPIILKIRKKTKSIKCHICGKSIYQSRIEGHLSRHKKREKRASEDTNVKKSCQHCGKLVRCIRDHVRDYCHAIQREKSTCNECGKVFTNLKCFRIHMRDKHGNEEKEKLQYVCNICGKVLNSKGALNGHHRALHEIRELKIKCEQCGKLFVNAFVLKHHMRMHQEKKTCPVCGKKVRMLKSHIDSVHTKDEDKKFQCQDCGKGFMLKEKLEHHRINMHLKTKPYNCRYGCDIRYNDMSNRNAHEKRTHGKLFVTVKEERLKEKIEMLGLENKTFENPIM